MGMARAATTSDPFNAIAEPRRRHILEFLAGDERSVDRDRRRARARAAVGVEASAGAARRRAGQRAARGTPRPCTGSTPRRFARFTTGAACSRATGADSCAASRHTPRRNDDDDMAPGQPDVHHHRRDPGAGVTREDLRLAARADGPAERNARRQAAADDARSRGPAAAGIRDLGGDNGHLWGFVQSIKRPVLLEIWGPLFMSTAATSNLIYRLTEVDGGIADHVHAHAGRPVPRGSPARSSAPAGRRCTRACARPPKPTAVE